MNVLFHSEFPQDIRKFEAQYARISEGLAARFRREIEDAVEAVKISPGGAGHFLSLGSSILTELRRRNLRSFRADRTR